MTKPIGASSTPFGSADPGIRAALQPLPGYEHLAKPEAKRHVPVDELIRKGSDEDIRKNMGRVQRRARQHGANFTKGLVGTFFSGLTIPAMAGMEAAGVFAGKTLGVAGPAAAFDPTGTLLAVGLTGAVAALAVNQLRKGARAQRRIDRVEGS